MNEKQLINLLEVFTLEEILNSIDLEPIDLLLLLSEQGYDFKLPEPL